MVHITDQIVRMEKTLLEAYSKVEPSIKTMQEDSQLALTIAFQRKRKYWFGYEPFVTVLIRYAIVIETGKEIFRDVSLVFHNDDAKQLKGSTRAIVGQFFDPKTIN